MAIKSYTDISQSKTLIKMLPLESADMAYIWHATSDNPAFRFDEDMPPMVLKNVPIDEIIADTLPCWSLTALLDVLNKSAYFANEAGIVELSSIKGTKWCVSILNCGKIENCYADNPVDACCEMIIKLHELNLL